MGCMTVALYIVSLALLFYHSLSLLEIADLDLNRISLYAT